MMKISTTVIVPTPKPKHPYIGVSNDYIVLFTAPSQGVYLSAPNRHAKVGALSSTIMEQYFTKVDGPLYISYD